MSDADAKDEVLRLMADQRTNFITILVEPTFYRLLVAFYDVANEWESDTSAEAMQAAVSKFEEVMSGQSRRLIEQAPTAMAWTYETAGKIGLSDATHAWVKEGVETIHARAADCVMRTAAVLMQDLHPNDQS